MENTKYCSKCCRYLTIENFEEEYKTCKKCRNYRYRNKETINEKQRIRYEEDDEYRKQKREQGNKWRKEIVICSVCNCSLTQGKMWEHKQTKKHQRNLENQQAFLNNENSIN